VHRGRLRQLVGEVDDETIADLGADQRPRQAAVVGPGRDPQLGGDVDVGDTRGQVDFEDARLGIAIGQLVQRELGVPARRGERRRRLGAGSMY